MSSERLGISVPTLDMVRDADARARVRADEAVGVTTL
jgi:hypothetical protein